MLDNRHGHTYGPRIGFEDEICPNMRFSRVVDILPSDEPKDRDVLVDMLQRIALHYYANYNLGIKVIQTSSLDKFYQKVQELCKLHSTYYAAKFSNRKSFSEADCQELFGSSWELVKGNLSEIANCWREESVSLTKTEIMAAQEHYFILEEGDE